MEAFFDWLHGRPWPGAPSQPLASPSGAAPAASFTQLGWMVDTAQLAEGTVVAVRREPLPVVTVRIKLDPA